MAQARRTGGMMLYRAFDAAYPPATPPPGCTAVFGYIGGSRATHTWPAAAWAPFKGLRQIPYWVPAVTGCDLETIIDPAWYQAFGAAVFAGGFQPFAYGSLSTVLQNAASDVVAAA